MLEIRNLTVAYGEKHVLDGIDLSLSTGESLGIIGESGVGKTTLGKAVMGLAEGHLQGQIFYKGQDLTVLPEKELNALRWNNIAMVFQNVDSVLNPVLPVIQQVAEPMVEHGFCNKRVARQRAAGLLDATGLDRARHDAYPHQLSGGERQRAVIAMALANDPEIIILDEPTASLDALTRLEIMRLLKKIGRERALLVITHDISAAVKLCDTVAVLYGGKLVEKGPAKAVISSPRHPYTRGLLRSYPNMTTVKDLQGIKGRPGRMERGCCFHPRCTQAIDICHTEHPPLKGDDGHYLACHRGGIIPLLEARDIEVLYGKVRAVDGVSIKVYEGETLALVGESGSGKSTLAAAIMGLARPTGGEIHLRGKKVVNRDRDFYRDIQIIFQNPGESISHRYTVLQAVREPLDIQNIGCEGARREKVRRALDEVQLPSDDEFLAQYPHHLSGGEVQRVAIARALVLEPAAIVADEPTSALDASVQAKILKLLLNLQEKRGLGLLFITHDIALARKVSDRMAVMLAGKIVEEGPTERVVSRPLHPYTRALLTAAPDLELGAGTEAEVLAPAKERIKLPAGGCPFAARCPAAGQECLHHFPRPVTAGRVTVACHRLKATGEMVTNRQPREIAR